MTFILLTNFLGIVIMVLVKQNHCGKGKKSYLYLTVEIRVETMSYFFFKNIKYQRKCASFHYLLFFRDTWVEISVWLSIVLLLLPRIISVDKHNSTQSCYPVAKKNDCLPFRSQETGLSEKKKTEHDRTNPEARKFLE